MTAGRLSTLQERILTVLAGMEPRWTLTGGGALVGGAEILGRRYEDRGGGSTSPGRRDALGSPARSGG